MKVLLVIPLDQYDGLLNKCNDSRDENAMLRNGIITRDSNNQRIVEIPCEFERAQKILNLAHRLCPGAVPYIEQSIRRASTR